MPSTSPNPLLRAFLDYCRVECRLSANTLAAYGRDLSCFLSYLDHENESPATVDIGLLGAYLGYLAEGLSLDAASRARHLVTLRMFFRFAAAEHLLPSNPTDNLDSPNILRHLPDFLSVREVTDLVTADFGTGPVALRNRAILETLYATGARASEVCDLHVLWYSPQEHRLRVRGKRDQDRFVPLGEPATKAMNDYLSAGRPLLARDRDAAWMFLTRSGKRVARQTIWKLVSETARRVGIVKPIYPHLLRHSFASHMLQGGANLRSVQHLLGHASIATTEIYTHVDQTRLSRAYNEFFPRANERNMNNR